MEDTLVVALIQAPLAWENPKENLAALEPLVLSAKGADLVVLPEMFSTGFSMHPAGLAEQTDALVVPAMQQWAQSTGAVVCGSLMAASAKGYQNVFFAVSPEGLLATYAKRHLFSLAGEDKVYVPGEERVVFTWKGWRILPQVCYDLRFPVWSRYTKEQPFDAMVYVANWPNRRIQAWDALLPARAIENMAFVVGVNRTGEDGTAAHYPGHSGVWDCMGQPLLQAGQASSGVSTVSLHKKALTEARAKFGFLNDADAFTF